MQEYVLGFLFNEESKKVLLIEKNKPVWQEGKLNGLGGKIEEGESALVAMIREFKEECGLECNDWKQYALIIGSGYKVHVFRQFSDDIVNFKQIESEKIGIYEVDRLKEYDSLSNLKWLLELAIDKEPEYTTSYYK